MQVFMFKRSYFYPIITAANGLSNSVLNVKALVGAFNQEKALVGAFSVIVQPVVESMDRFAALDIIRLWY